MEETTVRLPASILEHNPVPRSLFHLFFLLECYSSVKADIWWGTQPTRPPYLGGATKAIATARPRPTSSCLTSCLSILPATTARPTVNAKAISPVLPRPFSTTATSLSCGAGSRLPDTARTVCASRPLTLSETRPTDDGHYHLASMLFARISLLPCAHNDVSSSSSLIRFDYLQHDSTSALLIIWESLPAWPQQNGNKLPGIHTHTSILSLRTGVSHCAVVVCGQRRSPCLSWHTYRARRSQTTTNMLPPGITMRRRLVSSTSSSVRSLITSMDTMKISRGNGIAGEAFTRFLHNLELESGGRGESLEMSNCPNAKQISEG